MRSRLSLRRAVATATAVAGVVLSTTVVTSAPAGAVTLPAPQPGAQVYLRPADGTFDLQGGGFGHGIGMSQYGAHGAALAGLSHAQILAFYYPGTSLVNQAPTSITVGITDNDGIVRVAARPGLSIRTGSTSSTLPTGPTQWRVRATSTAASGCVVESYNGTAWTAYRAGASPCPVTFSSTEGTVDVYLPSGERRVYRGAVTAHHRGTTNLATLNVTTMQNYLRGVVPSEMPPSWAAAALRSQTVAARTYAARRTNGTSYYDTCDTTSCQVYLGRGKRNSDGTISSYEYSATNAAIDATPGQVLTYRFANGSTGLATTMYSSSNGGQTAPGSAPHTYLAATADPYDKVSNNSRNRWTATLPVTSLESRFGLARLERIQILKRDGKGEWGGRVLSVRVEGTTASGAYRYVDTTGSGIQGSRPWPTYSTGLSSNYFTIVQGAAPTVTVDRLSGVDRFGTAAAVAGTYPTGVGVVYVASGMDYPDALTGAARASFNGGPLLLTMPTYVPEQTRAAMTRLRPGRVVVLGSNAVVSTDVAAQLGRLTTSGNVQRVAGSDRYATAAAMADYYSTGPAVVYLATGADFPDALSAAALAGRDRVPLLLTTPTTLHPATAQALRRLDPKKVVVLGSNAVVSDSVLAQAKALTTTGAASRLAGADRYGTSAAAASTYSTGPAVWVSTGTDFPDALAGAAVAGKDRVPLLITPPDRLLPTTATQVTRLGSTRGSLLGSEGALTDQVRRQLITAMGG